MDLFGLKTEATAHVLGGPDARWSDIHCSTLTHTAAISFRFWGKQGQYREAYPICFRWLYRWVWPSYRRRRWMLSRRSRCRPGGILSVRFTMHRNSLSHLRDEEAEQTGSTRVTVASRQRYCSNWQFKRPWSLLNEFVVLLPCGFLIFFFQFVKMQLRRVGILRLCLRGKLSNQNNPNSWEIRKSIMQWTLISKETHEMLRILNRGTREASDILNRNHMMVWIKLRADCKKTIYLRAISTALHRNRFIFFKWTNDLRSEVWSNFDFLWFSASSFVFLNQILSDLQTTKC